MLPAIRVVDGGNAKNASTAAKIIEEIRCKVLMEIFLSYRLTGREGVKAKRKKGWPETATPTMTNDQQASVRCAVEVILCGVRYLYLLANG